MSLIHLEILKRIPRGNKISTSKLRQQIREAGYDAEPRNMQRYMKEICARFDVECDDSSKPYGYRWKEGSAGLSVPGINAHEALLLLLAEQQLTPLLPSSLMSSLHPFFDQARRLLDATPLTERPGSPKRTAREWLDKVRVISTSVPVVAPKLADGVFEAVSEALLHNHMLNIDYRNAKGELTTNKRIKPLGLAQAESRLFLVCQYDGHSDFRNLALQRILSAVDTRMPFERPADFDLHAYDANGQFSYGKGVPIQLKAWVGRYLTLLMSETPLSEDQTLQPMSEPEPWAGPQPVEGSLLQATVVESELLVRWLRSQGAGVRVLAPASLQERL